MRPLRPGAATASAPFVLTGKDRGTVRLTAVDAGAGALGLAPGMGLAQARARVAGLCTAAADPAADRLFLLRLAGACESFSPRISLDGPAGLILDVTGCAHLFGGEAGLTGQVRARLARLGVSCRLTLAGTPDTARACARFSPGLSDGGIVPAGAEALAVRDLPVRALTSDGAGGAGEKTREALVRAGLTVIGDLADRPSQTLSARFDSATITRLHRILGREDARITPLRPPPDFSAEEQFAEPFTATAHLDLVIGRLAARLGADLARAGRGGRSFELSLFRSDGAVRRLLVETAGPLRVAGDLLRLFRLRLDGLADPLDPGFGYDSVRLAALASDPSAPAQTVWEGGQPQTGQSQAGQSLTDLIDRLITRFGRDRVLRFVAADTHDPLRAARPVSWLSPVRSDPWPGATPGEPPRRPLTIFDPPQPIEAMAEVPDSPPLRFRWRRVLHEVARAEGPERIAPDWWRTLGAEAPPARDYYRVEDGQGRRFWLCREGAYDDPERRPRWYVQGLFA